ncbi:type II toxin-antitoxin system VapC family toxin [Skermania sp. ID1734]|uniref:type II toxin-antitoxin system VapC family toxin n=1 Tax=Skermania sp. ID1734 TaxID=2597516 RepID=UPI001180F7B4|nr:type II toxin-antitoxin system VapC family toxin [Skermania sp. ID1734]TSD99429.1 type II toxin-antitoxin system VapC family toxin [Skermania sp. ID1734]
MTASETCDTSVLVPAVLSWHPAHNSSRRAVRERVATIPVHVLLETYSVLTRLPSPHRLAPHTAAEVVAGIALQTCALPPDEYRPLIAKLAQAGIRGGAVYDGLVAASAMYHGFNLITRDRRARPAYDAIGARYSLL